MNYNYKEISDKAYLLHQKKELDKAEKLYLHLLTIQPEDTNVLNLLGLLYISKKKEEKAINYLTKAFILKKNAYIASNLGKAYYFNSEYDNAIKIFNEALSIEPSEDVYYSLALTYKKKSDINNAIACYKKALEYNSENYKTYYNLSLAYKSIKDIDNALFYAEKSEEYCKDDFEVYTLLSSFYEKKKEYSKAINALKRATEINPHNYLFFYNLGVLYSKVEKFDEAIIAYNTAIMLNDKYVEAYVNIATIYKERDLNVALLYLEKAYGINQKEENVCLSLAQTYKNLYNNEKSINILNDLLLVKPKCAEAFSLLAINNMDIGNYEKALEYSNLALSISPKNCDYLHGKAVALKYLGKRDEAKAILETLLNKKGVSTQTIITLGMMYLEEKQFEKGMKLYRKRSEESKFSKIFKDKIWQPTNDVIGKTILLYSDCGLGDTIMYSRYLPFLKKLAKKVIVQTDKELIEVLKNNFTDCEFISKSEERPEYDYVMPFMDIQLALNMDFSNVPSKDKYIVIEENNKIFNHEKKNIGLFWQGNKKVFKNRSIKFDYLKKLLTLENADFYSFQIERNIDISVNVIDLSSKITSYMDTAILLKKLDVLVTIDSSIAHMAGAMGVKTCLLLPHIAEWRWFNDNDSCGWYNSVKIFKQKENGNWTEVIERVLKELQSL